MYDVMYFRYFINIKSKLLTKILYPAAMGEAVSTNAYKKIINSIEHFNFGMIEY